MNITRLTTLACLLMAACLPLSAAPLSRSQQIAALQVRAQQLQDAQAIRRLQRAYGYYMDKGQWRDAASLFDDPGKAPVPTGPDGPFANVLDNRFQLQPVISIAADAQHAVARWRQLRQYGVYGQSAGWAEGPLQVHYIKRAGRWRIATLQWQTRFDAPYAGGWAKAPQPPQADTPGFDALAVVQRPAAVPLQGLALDLQVWEQALRTLEGQEAIENLQAAYGYLRDAHRWDEAAALFTRDAHYEAGQSGVYRGRLRIRTALALQGASPLPAAELDNQLQLQPIIHVDTAAGSAAARWRTLEMKGVHGRSGQWGSGVQENRYVLEDGIWRIASLHDYVTFRADYDRGWSIGALPLQGPSTTLPPDAPPTEVYGSLPQVHVPPFHYGHPVRTQPNPDLPAKMRGDVVTLGKLVRGLQDLQAVQQLQRSYGYYVDKRLWDEAADLFATDATLEIGGRGVFVGRARIRQYLHFLGDTGPEPGWLYDHSQWQLLTTVAHDGSHANTRLRAFIMGGTPVADPDNAPFGSGTVFGEATYENAYIKRDGRWQIARLQAFFNFYSPYSAGWGKAALPNTTPEAALPPDLPPTRVYQTYPAAGMAPFHYANPVSGRKSTAH